MTFHNRTEIIYPAIDFPWSQTKLKLIFKCGRKSLSIGLPDKIFVSYI